jgi:hypothetical protein
LGFIEPVCVSPLSLQPVIVALANGPAVEGFHKPLAGID